MGMIERITEAEAAKDLASILERVRTQGVSFEIVRGEQVVARLEPPPAAAQKAGSIGDLIEALRKLPPLSAEDSAAWEKDLADIRKEAPMQIREWE